MTEQPNGEKADSFFQKPSFNARERLVCSHLIEGINATPLAGVLHTMQATLLLDAEKLDDLYIDMEKVVSIYTVAQRLAAAEQKIPYDKQDATYYEIYTFTLDFERDVKPWIKMRWYPHLIKSKRYERIDPKEHREELENMDPILAFHTSNLNLTPTGYQAVVSDFLEYASPYTQEVGGKLAGIISPETYQDLMRLFSERHRQ